MAPVEGRRWHGQRRRIVRQANDKVIRKLWKFFELMLDSGLSVLPVLALISEAPLAPQAPDQACRKDHWREERESRHSNCLCIGILQLICKR
jgi:hypothetical protein